MSSKSLIKSGSSLLTRLLFQPKSPIPSQTHQIPIFPHLFPSVSRPQTSFHCPKSDSVSSLNDTSPIHTHDFFHPSGLPSLRFFLPDGDSSSEPMLCIKRPFQPSTIRRKRNHGFFARKPNCCFCSCCLRDPVRGKATKGGRRVIARRIAKGRARITA